MAKRKQSIEALIVQFFHEAPLDACESLLRIAVDIVKRRRVASLGPKERKRLASQKPLSPDAPKPVDPATDAE